MLNGKKVLIFDLGGVVIDLFVDRTFVAMLSLGVPEAMLTEQGCVMNSTMMQFDRGDITADEMFGYIKSFLPAAVREKTGATLNPLSPRPSAKGWGPVSTMKYNVCGILCLAVCLLKSCNVWRCCAKRAIAW